MFGPFKCYGFEYQCDGHDYTFSIPAENREEAVRRMQAMSTARCTGEVLKEEGVKSEAVKAEPVKRITIELTGF